MQCFAAIAGSIREKTKMDITRPLNGYLSEIHTFLSSREHVLTTGGKKVLTANCHFNDIYAYPYIIITHPSPIKDVINELNERP